MITRRDSLERRVDKYGELICEGCGSFNQGGRPRSLLVVPQGVVPRVLGDRCVSLRYYRLP